MGRQKAREQLVDLTGFRHPYSVTPMTSVAALADAVELLDEEEGPRERRTVRAHGGGGHGALASGARERPTEEGARERRTVTAPTPPPF